MTEQFSAFIYLSMVGCVAYLLLLEFSRGFEYQSELKQLFGYWFLATGAVFLSNNYWIFCFVMLFSFLVGKKRNIEFQISLYIFMLLSLPVLSKTVPGFGIIDSLIDMSWPKLLSIGLLIPLISRVSNRPNTGKPISSNFDLFVFGFVIYISILGFRDTSFTNGLRNTVGIFLNIYLPYYVISRGLQTIEDVKKVQISIYIIVFLMAAVGIFSTFKVWHPYTSLYGSLDLPQPNITPYKSRAGFLRASAVYGSINLGALVALTIGIGLYLLQKVKSNLIKIIHVFILLTCLVLTFSRGPWVGFTVMLVLYLLLSDRKSVRIFQIVAILLICSPFFLFTEFGAKFIELLPFIGKSEASTVSYRELLFKISMQEVNDHPLFGTTTYLNSPRMQLLIQGEGIIDIVNTYLQIALQYGYIGLILFGLIVFGIPLQLFIQTRNIKYLRDDDLMSSGVTLILAFAVIVLVIGTVSSIGNEQMFTFIFAMSGLCVAYIKITKLELRKNRRNEG